MKNKELFEKTISILVKSFQNETLMHNDCQACAVGNLVAANKGIKLFRKGEDVIPSNCYEENTKWYSLMAGNGFLEDDYEMYISGLEEIKTTGYTPLQCAAIEDAFENKWRVFGDLIIDKDGYLGLMSVVDCLIEIHEANIEESDFAKSLFVKEAV